MHMRAWKRGEQHCGRGTRGACVSSAPVLLHTERRLRQLAPAMGGLARSALERNPRGGWVCLTVSPSRSTMSGMPPARAATTGVPLAMASNTTKPRVSVSDGVKKASALAYAADKSSPCQPTHTALKSNSGHTLSSGECCQQQARRGTARGRADIARAGVRGAERGEGASRSVLEANTHLWADQCPGRGPHREHAREDGGGPLEHRLQLRPAPGGRHQQGRRGRHTESGMQAAGKQSMTMGVQGEAGGEEGSQVRPQT